MQCSYCYAGEKSGPDMTEETADRALGFAIQEADRRGAEHLEIIFFGGEPLLKLDLLCRIANRAVEAATGLRVSFKMSTNGLLLSEDTIRELSERRVFVSLSIDGGPEVHDHQRTDCRGRGTFSRLEGVIDRLLEWNPCANVMTVVTPWSADRVDESVRWLYERGFAYITTTLDHSAEWTRTDFARLRESYRRLSDWYVERTLDRDKLYVSCIDERIRTWTRGPPKPAERCAIGFRHFSIAPSGRLYPCVQFVGDDTDDSLAIGDVWHGFDERRREELFQESEAEKPECGGCALQGRCSCWCACVNWQSTGRLDRPSPVVCEHERILMPIADRVASRLWKKRDPSFIHKHYNPAFPVLSLIEQLIIREEAEVEGK